MIREEYSNSLEHQEAEEKALYIVEKSCVECPFFGGVVPVVLGVQNGVKHQQKAIEQFDLHRCFTTTCFTLSMPSRTEERE